MSGLDDSLIPPQLPGDAAANVAGGCCLWATHLRLVPDWGGWSCALSGAFPCDEKIISRGGVPELSDDPTPAHISRSLSSGGAEPVIGRAFARPVGAGRLAQGESTLPFVRPQIRLWMTCSEVLTRMSGKSANSAVTCADLTGGAGGRARCIGIELRITASRPMAQFLHDN